MDARFSSTPYKTTPLFDENSLPAAIRNEHRTKAGVWGLLRMEEGQAILHFTTPASRVLVDTGNPAPIPPEATHYVEVTGPMKCRIEFYHDKPEAK